MSLEIAKLPLVQSLIQEYGFTNCDFSEIIFEKICKENSIDVYSVPPEDKRLCLESLNKFKSKAKQFYQENFRMLPRLLEKKKEWIAKPLVLPLQVGNRHKTFEKRGRPSTEWMEASARTKRRMTSALAEEDEALLASAAARAVRGNTCKKDFAFLMKEAVASPNRPSKIKKAVSISPPVKYSTEETIALMIRLDLSIREYKILKASLSQHKVKVFPSLREIAKERRNCYTENIIVSETKAECPLGSLLAHTSSRLLKVAENKIFSLFSSKTDLTLNATLHCKCGFDGASSQSIYKQKFDLCDDSLDEALKNQENLFSTCIVPLQLVIEDNIVWNNLVPSSIRFCRPIRIQYVKETPEICRSERDYLVTQLASIEKCTLHHITINNRQFKIKVKHEVVITMLDGKAVNALTNTSSTQTCNICGAKPSEMNNLHLVSLKDVEETHLHYGLSTLHCWIRFFEFILHLGYKLDIQKWQARTQEEKESVKRRKSKIQKDFKLTLGLTVDQPKVGSGNTNDGNTARKAFKNFEKMAEITGIKEDFVKRLYVILQVIASNQEIDCGNFNQYCLLTAKMFCRNYSWFKMPPSLHKVLIHGADVIQSQILPIGFYSEEAQECMNKYVRTARLHHSRKTSREETIMDQIRHLLILSDPLISSQKDSVKKQRPQTMTPEALSLLKQRFDDLNLSSSDEEEED